MPRTANRGQQLYCGAARERERDNCEEGDTEREGESRQRERQNHRESVQEATAAAATEQELENACNLLAVSGRKFQLICAVTRQGKRGRGEEGE